jgi:glycosyltransferase involved in cell wall biosynthesis
VLSSNRGSLPEVVGDAGLYFDPESPTEITAACLQLLGDPALQRKLRAAAEARVLRFTWERGAELTEQCFRRALGQS